MRSMTGFGSGCATSEGWEITAELKTVNHRFLDLNIRLPKNLSFLEQSVREQISERIGRGHVDVFINLQNTDTSSGEVCTDIQLAEAYLNAGKKIAEALGLKNDLDIETLMKMDGVIMLSEREPDQESIIALSRRALALAVEQVIAMREKEGTNLKEDLKKHLDAADELRGKIAEKAPEVVTDYRTKLEARLTTLLQNPPDPIRLAQEVAVFADRSAIDEELARLDSHIRQMRSYFETEGETGKKMDFLIQEMNREANTIGSKATNAVIAQYVVELKSEIEKLREQIQNVE